MYNNNLNCIVFLFFDAVAPAITIQNVTLKATFISEMNYVVHLKLKLLQNVFHIIMVLKLENDIFLSHSYM